MLLTDRFCYRSKFQQEEKRIRRSYKENDQSIKYKTELCKNWLIGECKFGDSCIFAHGRGELKTNSAQKHILCKNFEENHWCAYGEKCQFLHKHWSSKRLPIFINILLRSTIE